MGIISTPIGRRQPNNEPHPNRIHFSFGSHNKMNLTGERIQCIKKHYNPIAEALYQDS